MDEHPSTNGSGGKSWLERIGQALSGEPRSREQLIDTLRTAQSSELIDPDAFSMIKGVLDVSDMQVRDIMVPRGQMVVLPRDEDFERLLQSVVRSGHSRFPVIGENRDEVEGILLAKDLLHFFAEKGEKEFDLTAYLREPVYVPESKRLDILLREFRSTRNHMAIVVDEYGGVAGLVTIEDVLEQIVGEIDDEFDAEQAANIYRHSPTRHTVKALTPIEEFNDHFGVEFSDEEFDTIGGLVMHAFGHLPKRGESIEIGGLRFTVLGADKRRLYLLKVTVLSAEEASTE